MSAFLIIPKTIYGQIVCCNHDTGITDIIPNTNMEEVTYIAQELSALKWRLAQTTGDIGAVGFGVCCGTKECEATITITYDLTGLTSATVIIDVGALSGAGEIYMSMTEISGTGMYNITIEENGVVVSDVDITTPGIFTHTIIANASITGTACGGSSSAYALNYEGNDAPATVDVEFSFT